MPNTKSAQYHVEIQPAPADVTEWGVIVREDVTGQASIHVYGMTRAEAIHELRGAATALDADRPEPRRRASRPRRAGPGTGESSRR